MKLKAFLLAACAFSFATITAVSASERAGDFALLDHEGYFHHMSWYDNNKAVVFLVQTNDSQAVRGALSGYRQMMNRFADQELVFMMINPLGEERASVRQVAASYGLDIPVLIDDAQVISEALGVRSAGEALVYDPSTFRVVYQGPVGQPLEQALSQVLAGTTISNPQLAVQGEPINYPQRTQHETAGVSYVNDVAPIIAERCASCHRDGGIGPFALDSHTMAQGWSPMIREVLMTKRMPPGQVDPHIGKFVNGNTLTVEEQQKLLHWIALGSPRDGDIDPLAQLEWPATEWAFGEPDLVIRVPAQEIPATGVLPYINVDVPIELEEDRYVRASQYIAGDRTVLHHTLNSIRPPGSSGRASFLGGDDGGVSIQAYIPGVQPYHEPPNTGGLLRAGSSIALQLHYTTTGRATVDESQIGVWFYPEGEIPEHRMSGQCACIFPPRWSSIPPNDPNFEMTQSVTVPRDAHLHAFLPHMHFRGKYMRFYAHYPDGTSEELINIANYDYNWQIRYQLEEPKLVPAGTRIEAVGAFDNSVQNIANPDPSREVPWGQQSWDEMFFGAVSWQYVEPRNPSSAANAADSSGVLLGAQSE